MQLGVTDQVRVTFQKQNRTAAYLGATLGGVVPVATFWLAHFEAGLVGWRQLGALAIVLAGLLYSASTVYGWARVAFDSPWKAGGFVVLLEGTMTIAEAWWLSALALVVLVAINAVAAATAIALQQKSTRAEARAQHRAKAAPRSDVLRLVPVDSIRRNSERVERALAKAKTKRTRSTSAARTARKAGTK